MCRRFSCCDVRKGIPKMSYRNIAFKLSFELVDVAQGKGDNIRKREERQIHFFSPFFVNPWTYNLYRHIDSCRKIWKKDLSPSRTYDFLQNSICICEIEYEILFSLVQLSIIFLPFSFRIGNLVFYISIRLSDWVFRNTLDKT